MEISGDAIERGLIASLSAGLMAAIYGIFTMRDKVQRHEQILSCIPEIQSTLRDMAEDVNYMRGRMQERRHGDE